MSVASPPRGVGELLRDWRQRRRLSQLDLAVEADVSTRHLSFVETGRSRPSRELVVHLAEHLDVPLRERNALLLAAGYAPVYGETPLDSPSMAPVRDALDTILAGHEPFPAVIVDRRWDLVSANRPALELLAAGVSPALLEPPANAMRVCLHPDGLAPRITNLAEYSAHLLGRLRRQVVLSPDPVVEQLIEELRHYPGVEDATTAVDPASMLFVPFRLCTPAGDELTFFSTLATFGTPLDITLEELSIESFFPADRATQAALRAARG
jgi:transcriptional regulator with XRE-family HTH domain